MSENLHELSLGSLRIKYLGTWIISCSGLNRIPHLELSMAEIKRLQALSPKCPSIEENLTTPQLASGFHSGTAWPLVGRT